MHILLIHGAANSSGVWAFWRKELEVRGFYTHAIDLRGHGSNTVTSLSSTSMEDYAEDVVSTAARLTGRPVLVGWSMGGLVALMAAERGAGSACVTLAPSMPARRVEASLPLREGEFGPEEYGIETLDPSDQPAMPDLDLEERTIALASLSRESRYARDQRARGMIIGSLPCPLLLITGEKDSQWPAERYRDLWLPAERIVARGASHWGLVLNRRTVRKMADRVQAWLAATRADRPAGL